MTPDKKIIGISMAFGAVLGFWFGFSLTGNILSAWNFVLGFIVAIIGFLATYYFYKFFY